MREAVATYNQSGGASWAVAATKHSVLSPPPSSAPGNYIVHISKTSLCPEGSGWFQTGS